jgi:uncharacterized protein (DUF4415 family)
MRRTSGTTRRRLATSASMASLSWQPRSHSTIPMLGSSRMRSIPSMSGGNGWWVISARESWSSCSPCASLPEESESSARGARIAGKGASMKREKEFDFSRARRVTPRETARFRRAYENTFHVKPPPRGRPPKGPEKYLDVHIRLHPKALLWARAQAKRRGIGYQTFINELLLERAL